MKTKQQKENGTLLTKVKTKVSNITSKDKKPVKKVLVPKLSKDSKSLLTKVKTKVSSITNKNEKVIKDILLMKKQKEKTVNISKKDNRINNNSKIVNNNGDLFKTTAIIGCQWGDEGKGKITDFYSQQSDIIVRWSGGDNAGHTIVFDNQAYKLSIIPSGIFNKNSYNIIANGCVVNPEKLVAEIEYLKIAGFSCQNLRISNRAHVILPYHLALDECEEKMKGEKAIGTTKKGIGPCYADKINRIGIRIGDLLDENRLLELIESNLVVKNKILRHVYAYEKEFSAEVIYKRLLELLPHFKDLIIDTSQFLNEQLVRKKTILMEGAQGSLLDLDHGTYPFVTSSNPCANSIAIGAGIPLKAVNEIIGVTKAYSTRVGAGAFPSEITSKIADNIRKVGREYGTVSGRARRIGWFDAVTVKYSCQINGFTSLAIMLLDVLTGVEELKICTHYSLNNEIINYLPAKIEDFAKCQPQFITMPGWKENITEVKSYEELPVAAKNYLQKISELTMTKIKIFSVGPNRKQTVFIKE